MAGDKNKVGECVNGSINSFRHGWGVALIALCAVIFSANNCNAQTTIVTNYDKPTRAFQQGAPIEIPTESKMYHVSYAVYSKEFADRFGYPLEYVADLSPGMQALEFDVIPGLKGMNSCQFKTLIDNNLDIDKPDGEYFWVETEEMNFPQKRDSYKDPKGNVGRGIVGYREEPADQEFRINNITKIGPYYNRNIVIATEDYEFKERGSGSSVTLLKYSSKMALGMDYFAVGISCNEMIGLILKQPNATIWLKKKGGKDYSQWIGYDPKEFIKFKIPQEFVKRIMPVFTQVGKENDIASDKNARR